MRELGPSLEISQVTWDDLKWAEEGSGGSEAWLQIRITWGTSECPPAQATLQARRNL